MIDKLSKDDIYTLFTFLGKYINDKKKLVEIIEGLEEVVNLPVEDESKPEQE